MNAYNKPLILGKNRAKILIQSLMQKAEQIAKKIITKGLPDDEFQEMTELPLAVIQRLRLEH